MPANRIEVIQWREHGDDEDGLEVFVFGADQQIDDLLPLLREIHSIETPPAIGEWDEGVPGTIYSENHRVFADGQVIEGNNGRKFRINITELPEKEATQEKLYVDPAHFTDEAWYRLVENGEGFVPAGIVPGDGPRDVESFYVARNGVVALVNKLQAEANEQRKGERGGDSVEGAADVDELEEAADTLAQMCLGECDCDSRSWRGPQHDEACDLAGVDRS